MIGYVVASARSGRTRHQNATTRMGNWERQGATEGGLERHWWADTPVNGRLFAVDTGRLATLTDCAGVIRGLHHETSSHTNHQCQRCGLSLRHRRNHKSVEIIAGGGSLLMQTSASL